MREKLESLYVELEARNLSTQLVEELLEEFEELQDRADHDYPADPDLTVDMCEECGIPGRSARLKWRDGGAWCPNHY